MQRKALDRLLAAAGAIIAAVLLIAAGLLTWAHSYVHTEVHSQLSAQKIFFPPKGSEALAPKEIGPFLNQYAGQQLVNGAQAKAYADHFINVHLGEIAAGKTYAELSGQYQALSDAQKASPQGLALNGQVQTIFRGETLRGLLLNAYAFDTMGNIAFIGAIVAYVGAALMALLAALGFIHARRIHTAAPPTAAAPSIERIDA
jgi:hypothetical protein